MTRSTPLPDIRISAKLLFPFIHAISERRVFTDEELARIQSIRPDARVSLSGSLDLLSLAIERTQDPDLGLRAARGARPSDFGVLHYAVRSAPTVRDAVVAFVKFMRLLTDAVDYRLEVDGERAMVRIEPKVPLPRAALDYQATITHVLQPGASAAGAPGLEWWFTHDQPSDVSTYESTFAPATLRFSAPAFGYLFDKAYLDQPLPQADSNLNQIVSKHAELLLAELPRTRNVTEAVRDLIMKELAGGQPTATQVALRLRMNQRTLARRLQSEGTTFSALFDDVRRSLALRYLLRRDLRISEIVYLLGFSEVATFYRAFRRWTGQTPVEYRRSQGALVRTDGNVSRAS